MNASIKSMFALTILLSSTSTSYAGFINGDLSTSVPRNGTGGGWTTTSVDGAGGWQSSGGNPGGSFILNDNGASDDPTIEQTVTGLTIGTQYDITGDYSLAFDGGGDGLSFGVLLDDVAILQLGNPSSGFESFATSFIATSMSHTIGFASERNGFDDAHRVDNLAVNATATAVPEPASLTLFGLGAAIMVVAVSRRRRDPVAVQAN